MHEVSWVQAILTVLLMFLITGTLVWMYLHKVISDSAAVYLNAVVGLVLIGVTLASVFA